MPSSPLTADPWVHRVLATIKPTSALDIGVGCGRFGFIFREKCESKDRPDFFHRCNWRCKLHGIEAFGAYIGEIQRLLYDEIYVGDALSIIDTLAESYDLIHLGDVLEHIPKQPALQLVRSCYERARKGVLLVMPYQPEMQGAVLGNNYEIHRSQFLWRDFKVYPYRIGRIVREGAWPSRLVIYLSICPIVINRFGATTGVPAFTRISQWWVPNLKATVRRMPLVRKLRKRQPDDLEM